MINLANERYADAIKDYLKSKKIGIEGDSKSMMSLGIWYYILSKNKRTNDDKVVFTHREDIPQDVCNCHVIITTKVDDSKKDSYPLLSTYISNKIKTKTVIHEDKQNDFRKIWVMYYGNPFPSVSLERKIAINLVTLFPKLFPDQVSLSRENITLIKQCEFTTSVDNSIGWETFYNLALANIDSEMKEIVESANRTFIKECLNYGHEKRLVEAERRLDSIREKCQTILKEYNVLVKDYNEQSEIYEGMRKGVSEVDISILNNMLSESDQIVVTSMGNGLIDYEVRGALNVFDKDAYLIKTTASDINNISILDQIPEDSKQSFLSLLNAIFLERKYKIRTVNFFALDIDNVSTLDIQRLFSNSSGLFVDYMPHPHGQFYGCAGTYPTQWNEALQDGNLAAAIQYTISYTSHINWNDFTVCSAMVKSMWANKDTAFIEDQDGNVITPMEAMRRESEAVE